MLSVLLPGPPQVLLDGRLLNHWRSQLLGSWAQGELDKLTFDEVWGRLRTHILGIKGAAQ